MTREQEIAVITKYDLYYESRLTKLESISELLTETTKNMRTDFREITGEIKRDLRWMFGIMLGFSSVLLGLIAKAQHFLGS